MKCFECQNALIIEHGVVRCVHPLVSAAMVDPMADLLEQRFGPDASTASIEVVEAMFKLAIELEPDATRNGSAHWPFRFTPDAVKSCTGFLQKENE